MMRDRSFSTAGVWLVLVSVTALVTGPAGAQPEQTPPVAPASPEELLQRLTPLPPQMKGWRIAPGPRTAQGPAALALLPPEVARVAADYQLLWVAQFSFVPETPPDPVLVEVLRFADPLDAFGTFAQFRLPDSTVGEVRSISYWNGSQLHLWRDGFYVRVTPTVVSATGRAAAMASLEPVVSLIPLPEQQPLMMRLMPEGRLVNHSLRYYRQNLLGRLPLGDGIVGNYVENDTQLQLALLRYPDDEAARQAYCDVANVLAPGTCGNPLSLLGKQAQVIPTEQFGLTYLMHEGRFLAMALDVHDRDAAEGLLRITATNIRIIR